jgi:probable HAF family extracellular repeat protein
MTLTGGEGRAFFYDGNNVINLGTISGSGSLGYGLGTAAYSSASDINDSGTIVGNYGYSGYQGRGFVYTNGKMSDLNELLESSALNTWVITDAMAINNNGTIVAYGYRQGEFIGTTLVLTPNEVPEPVSFSLVLIGVLGILSVGTLQRAR